MCDATLIQTGCGGVHSGAVGDGEAQVVQASPILVEAVGGRRDRAQAERNRPTLLDHSAVQEPELLPSLLIGIGWTSKATGSSNTRSWKPATGNVSDGWPHVGSAVNSDAHARVCIERRTRWPGPHPRDAAPGIPMSLRVGRGRHRAEFGDPEPMGARR